MQYRHARRATGAAGGTVQFAGIYGHGILADLDPVFLAQGQRKFAKRNMRPIGIIGMGETQLLVGRARNFRPHTRQVGGFIGANGKSERSRVDDLRWSFAAKAGRHRLRGEVEMAAQRSSGAWMRDPDGRLAPCLSSPLARCELRLERRGAEGWALVDTLRSEAAWLEVARPSHTAGLSLRPP